MRLNLGCGQNKKPGFLNVDKYGSPDLQCDLEQFPWPWPDNSVSEVWLIHVLEHLGREADVFIGIMKELYRVCRDGAVIKIAVPHPRHDDFLNDPTHVRIVTPEVLGLFSKKNNLLWQKLGAANSPLALYHDVDFETVAINADLDEPYASAFRNGTLNEERLKNSIRTYNNVIRATEIDLKVVK
jgi:hypothetical protein